MKLRFLGRALTVVVLPALTFLPARAQDSAAIQNHIDNALRSAGPTWREAANYFCSESSSPNRPTDPAIAPTRLFDNLSVVGSVGTVVYILQTSQGLILIDAGYPEQVDSVLIPGLKALHFDSAQVRYVIVTHGHSDHFGAARYLQDTYGAKVFLSKADWDLLDAPPAQGKGAPAPQPKRDQVVADLQPIVLGDTSILPVLIPGHTPGALALIFPVFDNGKKYMAGLFGGTVLTPGFVSAQGLRDYIQSVPRYARIAAENHVTVEVQNHPLMDGFAARLQLLKQRGAQQPHPFVIGEQAYAAFLNVMSECAQAQLLRKGN
ncbi:MAG TPA: MBL fold metallo-hydrolase [Bryobacteraceae bacterium]|jgi:metallo-beta-lactamase class B